MNSTQLPFSVDLRESNPQRMSSFAPDSAHFWLADRARLREKRTHATIRRIDALSRACHNCLSNLLTQLCYPSSFSLHPIVLHALRNDRTLIGKVLEKRCDAAS